MENFLDVFGIFLWILAGLFPIFILIYLWRFKKFKWYYRILIGLLIGVAVGFLLFWAGLAILLRHGFKMM
jgi:lipoprotein signal peptidase